MAYDPGAIDSTLAAAVGEERELVAELRLAFLEGAERCLDRMDHTGDRFEWREAAARLRGLAASFGAVRLMALAEGAMHAGPDEAMLAKLRRAVARL